MNRNDVAVSDTANAGPKSRKTIVFIGASLMLTIAVITASLLVYWLWKTGGENNRPVRDLRSYLPAPEGRPSFSVPSPTPLVGPGPFACDHYGICNVFDENKRAACPETYADRSCLNECQKTYVRCPK